MVGVIYPLRKLHTQMSKRTDYLHPRTIEEDLNTSRENIITRIEAKSPRMVSNGWRAKNQITKNNISIIRCLARSGGWSWCVGGWHGATIDDDDKQRGEEKSDNRSWQPHAGASLRWWWWYSSIVVVVDASIFHIIILYYHWYISKETVIIETLSALPHVSVSQRFDVAVIPCVMYLPQIR